MMNHHQNKKRRRLEGKNNKHNDYYHHVPHLPPLLLVKHVFPFLDRITWNHFSMANHELHDLSQDYPPYWPHGLFSMESAVYSLAFHPSLEEQQQLAVCGAYGMLQVWNVRQGPLVRLLGHDQNEGINSVTYHPDGSWLASASDDRTVRIWDTHTWECRHVLKHPRTSNGGKLRVQCIQFTPGDGAFLASGADDGRVRLWNMKAAQEEKEDTTSDNNNNNSKKQPKVGQLIRVFRGWNPHNSVQSLAVWPHHVAFGGSDRTVRVKNLQTESRASIDLDHCINALAVGGGRLAVGCRNQTMIRLYSINDNDNEYYNHDHSALPIDANNNNNDDDNSNKYKHVGYLVGHSHNVTSLVFQTPTILISASEDSTIRTWDMTTFCCTSIIKSDRARCLLAVAISPDHKTLACGNITRNLCLFPVK